jgi:hypothetical protein
MNQEEMKRYELKFVVDPLELRFKKEIDNMVAQVEFWLTNILSLEDQVYSLLDSLGVDPKDQPHYVCFAKRVEKICLCFQGEVKDNEVSLVKQEYVTRGWNESVLDKIIPLVQGISYTKTGWKKPYVYNPPAWAYDRWHGQIFLSDSSKFSYDNMRNGFLAISMRDPYGVDPLNTANGGSYDRIK